MTIRPLPARFEFATAQRIVFGRGAFGDCGALARGHGRRPLVVTGRDPARAQPLWEQLESQGLAPTAFRVAGEPTVELAVAGAARARAEGCDLVIGLGGGSALDAAKAIAALLTNPGDVFDYLEVIGRGRPLDHAPAPCLAVPTTAGTGAEVTRNAVLASPTHQVKVSLRSPLMLPRVALVDPALTDALPAALTASTGLDALTQLIEPYVCNRPNPLVDAVCVEGLAHAAAGLRRACEAPGDRAARDAMACASLCGGLALANAGLGAVHGFAAPLGGRFPAPHGAVCAALLPQVMEANVRALRTGGQSPDALRRYDDVARLLTGQAQATADAGVAWVRALVQDLGIPPLRAYGVGEGDLAGLADQAARASSMKANPVTFTPDELTALLRAAL